MAFTSTPTWKRVVFGSFSRISEGALFVVPCFRHGWRRAAAYSCLRRRSAEGRPIEQRRSASTMDELLYFGVRMHRLARSGLLQGSCGAVGGIPGIESPITVHLPTEAPRVHRPLTNARYVSVPLWRLFPWVREQVFWCLTPASLSPVVAPGFRHENPRDCYAIVVDGDRSRGRAPGAGRH